MVLLHGLFGALSNWKYVLDDFSKEFRVLIPMLPIYKKTKVKTDVLSFAQYAKKFIDVMGIEKCTLLGNSLGGHIGLIFAREYPENVEGMILTGSSGLFESGMGGTFPKRGSMEYVKERVAYTFYDPKMATEELIDEVYTIVNDNYKALRVLRIARDAQRHNMKDDISSIRIPTLLVWGLNDNITPPHVAHEFNRLLPDSELKFIDKCGHAAMMEQPEKFNGILRTFLEKHKERLTVN